MGSLRWHVSGLFECMRSPSRMVLAVILLLGLGLSGVGEAPRPRAGSSVPAAASVPVMPVTPPAVRLQEELVYAPVVRAPGLTRVAAPLHRVAGRRASEPPRLASRARRLLFGDGTYRPEPFPRPTRD